VLNGGPAGSVEVEALATVGAAFDVAVGTATDATIDAAIVAVVASSRAFLDFVLTSEEWRK
jgi:hypothetical protein